MSFGCLGLVSEMNCKKKAPRRGLGVAFTWFELLTSLVVLTSFIGPEEQLFRCPLHHCHIDLNIVGDSSGSINGVTRVESPLTPVILRSPVAPQHRR